jgi:hypothetical protein
VSCPPESLPRPQHTRLSLADEGTAGWAPSFSILACIPRDLPTMTIMTTPSLQAPKKSRESTKGTGIREFQEVSGCPLLGTQEDLLLSPDSRLPATGRQGQGRMDRPHMEEEGLDRLHQGGQ